MPRKVLLIERSVHGAPENRRATMLKCARRSRDEHQPASNGSSVIWRGACSHTGACGRRAMLIIETFAALSTPWPAGLWAAMNDRVNQQTLGGILQSHPANAP